ncbi:hypothetical protein HID58_028283 [Brassica napus]|uniref:Glutamate dehydrogenase n=1 Tax=Brassica napus TaxID=3708 RepID=A0ABQ8CAS0_BRANA|nr:hypothetical protein HID58_028283 [Brassica napus]
MLVSDLIVSESADWNVEKIKLYLPQYEDLIMKLVPSACDMSDNLVWLPENSGIILPKQAIAEALLKRGIMVVGKCKSGIDFARVPVDHVGAMDK